MHINGREGEPPIRRRGPDPPQSRRVGDTSPSCTPHTPHIQHCGAQDQPAPPSRPPDHQPRKKPFAPCISPSRKEGLTPTSLKNTGDFFDLRSMISAILGRINANGLCCTRRYELIVQQPWNCLSNVLGLPGSNIQIKKCLEIPEFGEVKNIDRMGQMKE